MKSQFFLTLSAIALMGTALPVVGAVFVNFETSEGFTENARSGPAGWTFSNDARIRISNSASEPARNGSLSLYTQGGSAVGAQHLSLASRADALDTFDIALTSPTTSFSSEGILAWIYVFMRDESAEVNRNINFQIRYGTSESSPFRLFYRIPSLTDNLATISASIAIPTGVFNPSVWNDIQTVFDFDAMTYGISLNGTSLISDIALPSGWDVAGITGTWLVSGTAGTTTFYDALSITQSIPEPSTYALIGLGAVWAWTIRHRKGRPLLSV